METGADLQKVICFTKRVSVEIGWLVHLFWPCPRHSTGLPLPMSS